MTETEYEKFKSGEIGFDNYDVSLEPLTCKFIHEWKNDIDTTGNNPLVLIEWDKGSTIPQRFVVLTKIKLLQMVDLVKT